MLVVAGDHRVLVSMSDSAQVLALASANTRADARVEGSPGDVYRALWNRPAAGDVTREADPTVLQRFEARLALGMS